MAEEILQLTIDARGAEDGARRATRSIDDVTAAAGRGAASTDDLERRFRSLSDVAKGSAAIALSTLSRTLTGFTGLIAGAAAGLGDLTAHGVLILSRGMRTMADGMRDANGELTAMGQATDVAATGLEKAAHVALTLSKILLGIEVAAVATGAGITVLGHKAAAEFAPAWNRVLTLLDDGDWDRIRDKVSDLAGALGIEGVEAANTFYNILSAMPQFSAAPERALGILETSLKVAATGFADAATAASAVTGVLQAFNLDASKATEVSDDLFRAQKLGVTTFGEIASSIGRVSGLAASLGVDFTDVLAIISTATSKLQLDTNVALTELRAALGNILRPTATAAQAARDLGVDFSATALRAKGLNDFLLDLIETTGGKPEVLAKFFGSQEALSLVVGLAQNVDRLNDDMAQFNDTAGETDRILDTMNDSWEAQERILGGQFRDILRDIGLQYEEIGVKGLQAINILIKAWRDFGSAAKGASKAATDANAAISAAKFLGERLGTAPFTLPPVVVTGPSPEAAPPVPVDTAALLDAAIKKIHEFSDAQQAAAIITLSQTGNTDAYREALLKNEDAVNDLVLAEAEHLRQAGATAEANKLIVDLYHARADAVNALTDALRELDRRTGGSGRDDTIRPPEIRPNDSMRNSIITGRTQRTEQFENIQSVGVDLTPVTAHTTLAERLASNERLAAGAGGGGGIPFSTIGNIASTASMVGGPVGSLASSVSQVAGAFAVGGPLLGGIALAGTAFKGISGLFDDGKSALQEFVEAVQAANQALDAEFALLDIDDVQQRFDLTLKQAQGVFSGTEFEGLLSGLTLGNIDDLIKRLLKPEPGHAKLNLASADEETRAFIDFLLKLERLGDQAEHASDGLRDLANVVTDVPKALNLALYRQMFGTGLPSDPNDPENGSTSAPGGPTDTNGSIPGNPTIGFQHNGDVVIVNEAGDTPEDLVEKWEKGVQRRWSRGESTYGPGLRING